MLKRLAGALGTGACVAAIAMAAPAPAFAQAGNYDIRAGSLRAALDAWARQSRRQVIYRVDDLRGARSQGARGALSADAALAAILARSGFASRSDSSGAVAIVPAEGGAQPSGEIRAGGAAADSESVENQNIVVVGTYIRGIRNRTAPVTTLDRDYIESTGYGTTTSLIESLPQNFALASQSAPLGFPGVTSDRSQGAAINLRGIGEGTTLVLLDGRRLPLAFTGSAADISMLPLSAIDRVEVLTDGASALYGADAVGGVVNFVLRREFEGAETRLRAGIAPGGLNEYRASQTFGTQWGSGSALVFGEYYHRDLLPTADRDFVPAGTTVESLLPRDDNVSVLASIRQDLGASVRLFADALYTNRDSYNRGGRFTALFAEDTESSIEQISANAGLKWSIGPDWRVELAGGYGRHDLRSVRGVTVTGPIGVGENTFETWSGDARADGPLFDLPGGPVRVALGASYRSETFDLINTQGGFVTNRIDEEQEIFSAFGELSIPLFGAGNAVPGLRRLELSLAGRFDDFSNFGSSFDPRIGIAWEPVAGLLLRGSYGTSYVAPKLSDYDTSNTSAAALFDLDPGSPAGFSYQLQVLGGADVGSLRAQESRNITLGVDLSPVAAPGLRIALGYYDIKYRDQIALPPQSAPVILGNPDAYGSLFIRNPTVAEVQQYIAVAQAGQGFFPFDPFFNFDPNFDPASIEVILDGRRRNLALVRTKGLDFLVSYDFEAGGSNFHLGLNGVYVFERTQQVTEASAAFDTIDTIFNPPELRMRGSAGWRRAGWSANAFLNYSDSYTDNRTIPSVTIGSWTTVDLSLAYRFQQARGALSGVTVALSATNVFDRDPRATRVLGPFDIGFDPANASPLGRLVAFEITKRW